MSQPYAIKMPQLSDTMTEGVVVSWEKQPGDKISRGDIVATVETDKAIMDVEVFRDGYLSGPLAAVDSVVEVGDTLAHIVESESDVAGDGEASRSDSNESSQQTPASSRGDSDDEQQDAGQHSGSVPADAYTIKMPQLSDTMTEGVVVSWEKQPGDKISRGDIVATVETDKAIMDVEVFRDGYLSGPLADIDSVVPVGEALAYLVRDESHASRAGGKSGGTKNRPASKPGNGASKGVDQPKQDRPRDIDSRPDEDAAPAPRPDNKFASPYARRLAGSHQVNLNSVTGSGPNGVIIASDVLVSQPIKRPREVVPLIPAHDMPEVQVAGEGRKMSAMERAVSHNMTAALTLPTFSMTVYAKPDNLMKLSKKLQVSFSVTLAKACAQAMRNHPSINSCYQPVDRIVEHEHVDVGMAVATEGGGLVVPVLRQCESRELQELNEEWRDLVSRARKRRLKQEEYMNSTFQISNLGMYDVAHFNAIPMPGLGAILAISSTGDKGMPLTLTSDHRVINGAQAAEFLRELKSVIEDPRSWVESTGPAIPEGDWDYDVVVLGGGPGGEDCARELAMHGVKVAMVMDAPYPGGECLWRGCIPSKTWRVAADRIRDRKHDATLGVEGTDTPALNWKRMEATRREILKTRGEMALKTDEGIKVEVIRGYATFVGEHTISIDSSGITDDPFKRAAAGDGSKLEKLRFGAAVIATGAPPALPPIDGLKELAESGRVLTSDTIWHLDAMPASLAVIGGGAIGMEMAQIFSDFGCEVSLFEIQDRVLPEVEAEIASSLRVLLEAQTGLALYTSTQVKGVKALKKNLRLTYVSSANEANGKDETLTVEHVLVATGKRPRLDTLNLSVAGVESENGFIRVDKSGRTSAEHIFAVGDVIGGLMLAHTAGAQGRVAAANLLGENARYDSTRDCGVVFTRPQAAFVGLSLEQAKTRNLQAIEVKVPMKIDARAMITSETDGMIKLVAERDSGRILGVHFLTDHADTLIGEAVLMVSCGLTLEQVANAIHPHPTQTELFGEMARRLLSRLRRSKSKERVH